MKSFEVGLHGGLYPRVSPSRILVHELDGLQGRADLVDAHINQQALPDVDSLGDLAKALNSPTKARLLAILRYGAPRTRAFLARVTGLSDHSLARHVRQLESVGLVEVDGNVASELPGNPHQLGVLLIAIGVLHEVARHDDERGPQSVGRRDGPFVQCCLREGTVAWCRPTHFEVSELRVA